MKTLQPILLLFVLTSACTHTPKAAKGDIGQRGFAKFEIFGMLDEYWGRKLGGEFVEQFYPDEKSEARRFGQILHEFCLEEGIPPKWNRRQKWSGHTIYTSPSVAPAINRYYPAVKGLSYAIEYECGTLNREVFHTASHVDLMRYVVGYYSRRGDKNDGRRAALWDANASFKSKVMADILRRLGCRNVLVYSDAGSDKIPTCYAIFFSPTEEIKAATGLCREMTKVEIREFLSDGTFKPYAQK